MLTRRTIIRAGAGLAVGGFFIGKPRQSLAADFVLKYANQMPENNPINVRARQAIEKIKSETNGAVEIKLFPNSQLGGDSDMISQLRSGALDFNLSTGPILGTLVPSASAWGVGFIFDDYATVWKAIDGGLGDLVRRQIAQAGLHVFEKVWDNGFRQLTTSTGPVVTPEDVRALKIRVPPSPVALSLFRSLGASPVSLPIAETYTALQTKLVDGQENPLINIDSFKLYEVQKYASLTSHMWDGFYIIANRKNWSRIPPDIQAVISRHFNAAALQQREDAYVAGVDLKRKLEAHGVVFNAVDRPKFRDRLRASGYFAEWRQKYGDETWSTLQKFTGDLS